MQLTLRHHVLSALLLAAAGCGGGLGGPSDPNTYDGFREQFRAAVCAQSVACEVAPSVASCQTSWYPDNSQASTTRDAVRLGTIRFDAAKASSCLRYMNRAYAETPCSITAMAAVDTTGQDDCDTVLSGTIADGGSCLVSYECVSGNCQPADPLCYLGDQCCPGTCAPMGAPIPLGGNCSVADPGAFCAKGTACVTTTTWGTCQVPSAVVGTPCAVPAECAAPLFCVIDPVGTTGTCQPPIPSGAPCDREIYNPCDDMREYCHATTSICSPRAAVGAACDADNECVSYAQCTGGKCVALPGPGGACGPSIGVPCLGSLQCPTQTNTCEIQSASISCLATI